MDKQALEALTQFCVEQRSDFDPSAWHSCDRVERRRLAATARYLSMTSWYGHETELELIAESLLPGISDKHRFSRELLELGIDIAYLSAKIRYHSVELRRLARLPVARLVPFEVAARPEITATDLTRVE